MIMTDLTHSLLRLRKGLYGLFAAVIGFILLSATAIAAPKRPSFQDENSVAFTELRDTIDFLRHEVSNQETEVHMLTEKINNQESTIDGLRQTVFDTNQANKDFLRSNLANADAKIQGLELANKGLITDICQLRTHANESSALLEQYKRKISELEQIVTLQNQNIDNMHAAMRSLTEALSKETAVAIESDSRDTRDFGPDSKIYRIKPGDNLEKIARSHNTSVKAIKELNNLSSDKIVVGKLIKIP